eukprot:476172_1
MGNTFTSTSPSTSNGWTPQELFSGWKTTEVPKDKPSNNNNPPKKIHKKKKKKKKQNKNSIQRTDTKLITFYKNDRRFITIPTESKEDESFSIRIMTYNILADGIMYALSNRHNYCPKQYRKWGFRYQSILCQFQAYSPDIICIQETTPSTWKHKMQPRLKKLGYIGIHAARELVDAKFAGLSQSDCVIWKENKFTKIKHKILRLNKFIKKNNNKNTIPYDQHYDTLLGSNKSMFRSFVASCYDVVIVLHFKCNQTNKQFIVCSSHFYWDPNNPEVKSTQALIFNRELEKLLKEWSPDFMEEKESVFDINKIPIVFGVDSNSLPWKDKKDKFDLFLPENGAQSGVYRLMINGKLERTHKDHPYCRINEREKRYQKKHNGSIGNVKMSRKEVEYV